MKSNDKQFITLNSLSNALKKSGTFAVSLALLGFLALLPSAAEAACTAMSGVGIDISLGGAWGGGVGGCHEDPVGALFRQAVTFFTGITGRALCTIAILIAGIGALYGRITWVRALVIALGIALIFGSLNIMHAISGGVDQGTQLGAAYGTCDDPIALSGVSFASVGFTSFPLNLVCDVLKKTVNALTSSTGQGMATLAVVILGLSALFGKLSPTQALLAALGIGFVFGAVSLVNLLWANSSNQDCVFSALMVIGKPEFVLCRFLQELRGDSAKFLGTMAVIILGFLAMIGRLSWGFAIVTFLGIAVVYGSDAIMNIIAPGATRDCNTVDLSLTYSASLGAIEGVLCSVVRLISGTAGRALASAAVVMLGFGAMMGKVNYTSALVVAIGIGLAFGAPQMVFIMTGMVDQCMLSVSIAPSVNVCSVWGGSFR